jgi:hypothetical protein
MPKPMAPRPRKAILADSDIFEFLIRLFMVTMAEERKENMKEGGVIFLE